MKSKNVVREHIWTNTSKGFWIKEGSNGSWVNRRTYRMTIIDVSSTEIIDGQQTIRQKFSATLTVDDKQVLYVTTRSLLGAKRRLTKELKKYW